MERPKPSPSDNKRKNSRKRPMLHSSASSLRRVGGSLGVVRSPSVRARVRLRVPHTHTHTCARARTRTRGAYRRSSRRGRKDGDEARLYGARTRASKSGGRSSGLCCGRQLRGWRSGLHPRRGWRGVDQYVKIESDATHPAPQAPLRASTAARSGWGYRGSIDWFVTHASFSSTLRGTSGPDRRPYGIRFVRDPLLGDSTRWETGGIFHRRVRPFRGIIRISRSVSKCWSIWICLFHWVRFFEVLNYVEIAFLIYYKLSIMPLQFRVAFVPWNDFLSKE